MPTPDVDFVRRPLGQLDVIALFYYLTNRAAMGL